MKIGGKTVLGRGPSVNIATSYQNCSRVVTVVEGEGLRIVFEYCKVHGKEEVQLESSLDQLEGPDQTT
jgi:hypothetical protein